MQQFYIKTQLIILVFIIGFANAKGQDIHFSQFYNSPQNLNPALTGLYHEDVRITANYRNQWFSVPVPFSTFSAGYDLKLLNDGRLGDNILGAGIIFNYDQAGDSKLHTLQIGGSLAYTMKLNKHHFITLGTQLSIAQRGLNASNLTFDEQFVDGSYTAGASTGETLEDLNFVYADVAVGLNWLFQISKRMQFKFGMAVYHLNTPNQSFFGNDEIVLARRINLHIQAVIGIGDKLDLMPAAIYSQHDTQQERIFGTAIKYHLSQKFAKEKGIIVGVWYRMNDAAIPVIGVHYPNWQASLSYDTNVSDFTAASNTIGAVELSYIHLITNVKPMINRKACPIF